VTDGTPTYAPGTPMWTDHTSPDVQASTKFYSQLFGWDAEDMGEQAGHYTIFRSKGKMVAATTPPMSPGTPPVWSTYIATANAEDTAKKVGDAGGQVLMAPFQVMDQGSMAVFQDPAGAVFCVWQPAGHRGAELVNVPVSMSWNELNTRDMNSSKTFYSKVFGWHPKSNPMPEGGEYVEWELNGKAIGGGFTMGPPIPDNVPPHWLVYFTVADTDATVKKVGELGGMVMMAPRDIPQGRFAVVADPFGAPFAVIKLAGQ
jgi:predicted enzyme related to lactoylglutathione lyase